MDMLDDMLASTRAAQRLERAALCLPQPASKRRRSSLCEEFVHILDELDPQQALFDAVQDTAPFSTALDRGSATGSDCDPVINIF